MCLILFAVNPDDRYRLIVAANRDELFARPTKRAAFWQDDNVLAGVDENMGGTWLGVNRQGYFAAVTNFREDPPDPLPPRSRGDLPSHFLQAEVTPEEYTRQVSGRGEEYRGFNLIVASPRQVYYYGNRGNGPRQLTDGCYGLSNQLLDCDWPKVIEGRQQLQALIARTDTPDLSESLFSILLGEGDGREFSNAFITAEQYGTRAATVVLIEHSGKVSFEERNFGPCGSPGEIGRFTFQSA